MSKHTKSPSIHILNPLFGDPDHTNLRRANELVRSGNAAWEGDNLKFLRQGHVAIVGPRMASEIAHRNPQVISHGRRSGRGVRCILTTNISLMYEED